MQSGSFASNTTITATTNVLLAGIGILTAILAARLLSVDGRGQLAAIQLWPTLIASVAMLGLPEALVYLSARERERSGRYATTAVLLALAASGLFIVLGYWVMPMLLTGQSDETVTAARWYLAFIPIAALAGLPPHLLRGRGDFIAWNAVRVTGNTTWLAVLIAAGALGFASAPEVAAVYLGSLLALGLGIVWFVMRRVPGSHVPSLADSQSLLRFGIPSLSTTVPHLVASRLDQMLLVALFSPTMLGLYVVALGWAGAVMPLLSAIASVTFPRVAGITDSNVRNESFARMVRMSVLVACIAVVPIAFLAPLMVPLLFGADFSRAVTASMLLTLGMALSGVNHVIEDGLRGVGRPASILLAHGVGLPVTVVAMVTLIPAWGLEGASIASVAGVGTMFLVLLCVARSLTGVPVKRFCLPVAEDVRDLLAHGRALIRKRAFARNNRPT